MRQTIKNLEEENKRLKEIIEITKETTKKQKAIFDEVSRSEQYLQSLKNEEYKKASNLSLEFVDATLWLLLGISAKLKANSNKFALCKISEIHSLRNRLQEFKEKQKFAPTL